MRPVSQRFIDAINSSNNRVYELAATAPGETTATTIDIDDGSFRINPTGARYEATLTLSPSLGTDLYGLVTLPGTIFTIRSGVRYGGTDIEWVDCGVYEATSGNSPLTVGEIPLGLTDGTTRFERCRFTKPWAAAAGSRANAIAAMVFDCSPDVEIIQLTDGGDMPLSVFERDRLGAIAQIAADGSIDAAFDAIGRFVIRDQPVIVPTAPAWTAVTGVKANILNASRDMPFGRLYNTVIVLPIDETQTWAAVTVELTDPDHPRHKLKIGTVPYFHQSPMITTAAQAFAAGSTIMQQLLTTTDHIDVSVLGNPAIEYGDTVAVVHAKTFTDPGLAGSYLYEGGSFDLVTSSQTLTGRDTSLAELEES